MTPQQAFRLEQAQKQARMSDGELMQIAAQVGNRACGIRSLADLTNQEIDLIIGAVEAIGVCYV